jgi:MerR family transcriptional regulator, copper efflux regulator
MLRGLGLTIAEIRDLAAAYNGEDNCPFGPRLAELLRASRARVDARIAGLEQMRRRIDDFETAHPAELAGHTPDVRWTDDPRMRARNA